MTIMATGTVVNAPSAISAVPRRSRVARRILPPVKSPMPTPKATRVATAKANSRVERSSFFILDLLREGVQFPRPRPETAAAYADVLRGAKTIVFNGPMGVYEKPAYQNGTRVVGFAIAEATKNGATSVVGGGDAAAAAHEFGFADAMTHISTGGGATLEFLEGRTLPGIAALVSSAQSVRA